MQTIIRLATILTFLFSSNLLYAQSDDIIGKDDAKAMFAIGLEDWKQNLLMGKAGSMIMIRQQFRMDVNPILRWVKLW